MLLYLVFVLFLSLGCLSSLEGSTSPKTRSIEQTSLIGIWHWTWSSPTSVSPPAGTNLWIAFSGYTDVSSAISNSAPIASNLKSQKILSLGGGNAAGIWTAANLASVTASINNGDIGKAGYAGVSYDIEEGEAGLGPAFENSFAAAKSKGLTVIVTVSHSTPYGISDGADLMKKHILPSTNVDYISPQLYTTGYEVANDYAAVGATWNDYKIATARIIPSIVSGSMYADAQRIFSSTYGITLGGYIQWAQSGYAGSGPTTSPTPVTSSPPGTATTGNVCGISWTDAGSKCKTSCPAGVDSQCPAGERCYAQVTCSAPAPTPTPSPTPTPKPTSTPTPTPKPTSTPTPKPTSTPTPKPTSTPTPKPSTPTPTPKPTSTPTPTSGTCSLTTVQTWWISITSTYPNVSVRCGSTSTSPVYKCTLATWGTNLYQCSLPEACYATPVPLCSATAAAQDSVTVTQSDSDSGTTIVTSQSSSDIPGWAVGLLVLASIMVFFLLAVVLFMLTRRTTEMV